MLYKGKEKTLRRNKQREALKMKSIKEAATKMILEEGVLFFTILRKKLKCFIRTVTKQEKEQHITSLQRNIEYVTKIIVNKP